jgi:hypothetical protein
MFNVLFTLDYEIHGSGMGSPRELMVEPTARMLRQFDRHGAKLTILADVAEILKFKEYLEEHGQDRFGYEEVAEQLRTAVATGHDVQLHLHSAYFKGRWDEEQGLWRQDYGEYDLARLGRERLDELIGRGRDFLEQLLRPVKPDYRCFAFRAANWSMHPSPDIVGALVDQGFTVDTSVFKHGRYDELVHFDYTYAHSDLVPWPVDPSDVCHRDAAGRLFEFPIYCELQPIWTFLTVNRVYRVGAQLLNPLPAEDQLLAEEGEAGAPSLPARLMGAAQRLITPQPWKADFNQCTGRQLVSCLQRAERRYGHINEVLPFVLIGHSKTFTKINELSLRPFLRYIEDHPDRCCFGTFGDFDLERYRPEL